MRILKIIKLLNYKKFKSLFFIFIRQPLFIYPVLKATSISMLIAQKNFPNIHGKDNKANAFRHALWNILLVIEMLKWNKNTIKAIQFAKKITTWHEHFSPNKPMETAMDLHNNAVGRKMIAAYLSTNKKITSTKATQLVLEKLKTSKIVFNADDFQQNADELVSLEN